MKANTKKLVYRHLAILAALALYVFILNCLQIHCPFHYITGIPCPTCGMGRSLLAMLRLDLAAAFSYHPMTLPVCAAVLLGIHLGRFKRAKPYIAGFIIIAAMATMTRYALTIIA